MPAKEKGSLTMKNKVFDSIDRCSSELFQMADYFFDHPEVGHSEFEACKTASNYLQNHGFEVMCGVGNVSTAFHAVYESLSGGPSIGLLCEYDALRGIGHACAHHLQAPVMLGAAVALKEQCGGKMPFKLVVYSTPDEENTVFPGKIEMIKAGCFRDIDVAIIMHGGQDTTTDLRTLAATMYELTYHGKSAHAAVAPEVGRSAFDGLQMAFHGVEFMREHVQSDSRIHYAITDLASQPVNVVPNFAQGSVFLRSLDNSRLEDMAAWFEKIAQAGALMTQTTVEIKRQITLHGRIPILPLVDLFYKNAKLAGADRIEEPRKNVASTDFGNVQQIVPGIGYRVAFAPHDSASHSQTWLNYGKSPEAHKAISDGAKIAAGMALDIIDDPSLLEQIRTAWNTELHR